jgi:cell division protein FtsL
MRLEYGFQQTLVKKLEREIREKNEAIGELQRQVSEFGSDKALPAVRLLEGAPE